jgi:NAD(P)H-hydrate epimerase
MKIFPASKIKEWDLFTIKNEPVSAINLMERAAVACFNWVSTNFNSSTPFIVFCGTGNNGGDGLAIARFLISTRYSVEVYIIGDPNKGSEDFKQNLERLKKVSDKIFYIDKEESFPSITNEIVIDALFGTGLNKKPAGVFQRIIQHINSVSATVISVDVPSGLFIDKTSINKESGNSIIHATYTLSFQNQKLAFLMPENEHFFGEVVLLNIGLSKEFEEKESPVFELTDEEVVNTIYKKRNDFSHKGNYGYACLLAGSYGMMGAAILSSGACLRSGVGKLTCYICTKGYEIFQTAVPEAMCKTFGNQYIKDAKDFEEFNAIGIGPGIGKQESHKMLLDSLFSQFRKPLVIDADALNVLSENKELYKSIPEGSILTPHPKEFQRLFGKSENDFERIKLALEKAHELNVFIILKGHCSFIATPNGKGYFNSTGNSGMATAGSGDVLTGIITGLLAQNYSPLDAARLGVYLHGLAGDIAAEKLSKEAMLASDITENIGAAYKQII